MHKEDAAAGPDAPPAKVWSTAAGSQRRSDIAPQLFVALALVLPLSTPDDAALAFRPNHRPSLAIPAKSGDIVLDGDLSDPGWEDAAHTGGFCETFPGDQVAPLVDTEVWVTYDEANLYIAFLAHDDPTTIRASMRGRDQIFSDDYVGVSIDTYGSAVWCYELYVNPHGIQGDERWTPEGFDSDFDIVFESRGRITDAGYQVEMAIPFKSLKFPGGEVQSWRVNLSRAHPRDSQREYSWAALDRDNPCYPCQFGSFDGLTGLSVGRTLELLPAIVGSESAELEDYDDPGAGFNKSTGKTEVSLGIHYRFSSNASGEIALNPDFSQVESDAEQVDVNTTFALYFPEKRPFFMEGSELYETFYDLIYTRQINDPSVAVKLSGQNDRIAAVYLGGRDEETPLILPFEEQSLFVTPGKSYTNIGRLRLTFGEDSWIGGVVTDRRYDIGGAGTTAAVDLSYRFFNNYRIEAQAAGSRTEEPDDTTLTSGEVDPTETFADGRHTMALDGESYDGYAGYLSLKRDARHWDSDFQAWLSSPTFRGDAGFVVSNSERVLAWYNDFTFYIDNIIFDTIVPYVLLTRQWNAYDTPKGQGIENTIDFNFKGQTTVSLGYDRTEERFRDYEFRGIDLYYGEFDTSFWDPVSFGTWVGYGDRIARNADVPFLGRGAVVDVWATIKILGRFIIEPTYSFSSLKEPGTDETFFEGYIWRALFNLQFTRELALRFVVENDDFDGIFAFEPLLSWQLNPFTVFYLGANVDAQDYGHSSLDPSPATDAGIEPTSWQVFLKFQYLFRR